MVDGNTEISKPSESARFNRLGLIALAWWGFCLTAAVYAVHGSMDGENPVKLPGERDLMTVAYLPEGWKFFTRDAREEYTLLYKVDESGHWDRADRGSNASAKNLLGASRAGRNEHIEIGLLLSGVPKASYVECTDSPDACLSKEKPKVRVKNTATAPAFCGTVGVVTRAPVPWGWANSPKPATMTSKVLVMEVKC